MCFMLVITPRLSISLSEIEMSAIRSQGPGGQNVNKVASAIHLRFDVKASSLSDVQKERVLAYRDKRITAGGLIVIKAQNHRTQERNKAEALERLAVLLKDALHVPKYRRPSRPSHGAIKRRLKKKAERSGIKSLRGKVRDFD
jgi:ribosome-associated protein